MSLPLNTLKQQYRTGPVAQRAIEAAAATHDLATNPRVVVQILPELREVTAVAVPGSNPVRYQIPYGVLVPWEQLALTMSFREALPITVPEGNFTLEERKKSAFTALMGRYVRPDGLSRFLTVVPVSLPDSFQLALPKLESQDATNPEELRQWLQQLPTRFQLHDIPSEFYQGVTAASTLFTGNLLAWWQEKVSRAPPNIKNTAGYDNLSSTAADILAAFVTTDRQGDAFKATSRLTQGRRPLHAYHLQVNKALREYADAFNRAFNPYDPEQALFQYWQGLTNKQLVGYIRQYYSTIAPSLRLRTSCEGPRNTRHVVILPIILKDARVLT